MCTVWSRFFYWRKILVKADLSNTFNMVMASVENFLETLQKKFYLQNITIRRNFNSILRDLRNSIFLFIIIKYTVEYFTIFDIHTVMKISIFQHNYGDDSCEYKVGFSFNESERATPKKKLMSIG